MPLSRSQACFQIGYFLHVLSSGTSAASDHTRRGRYDSALGWLPNILRNLKRILEIMPDLEPGAAKMLEAIKGAEAALKDQSLSRITRLAHVDRMATASSELTHAAEDLCSRGG